MISDLVLNLCGFGLMPISRLASWDLEAQPVIEDHRRHERLPGLIDKPSYLARGMCATRDTTWWEIREGMRHEHAGVRPDKTQALA
jgi:hypothetical protein